MSIPIKVDGKVVGYGSVDDEGVFTGAITDPEFQVFLADKSWSIGLHEEWLDIAPVID